MYKGVGKMSVAGSSSYCRADNYYRFLMVPQEQMQTELKSQEKELMDDIVSLSKKVLVLPFALKCI